MNTEIIKTLVNAGIVTVQRANSNDFQTTMSAYYGDYTELQQNLHTGKYTLDGVETTIESTDVLFVESASYSDYSGGLVEQANCQALLQLCKEGEDSNYLELWGGCGTAGIVISVELKTESVWGALMGLSDYPVVDEELMQIMQTELEDDAYSQEYKSAFVSAIESKFESCDFADVSPDNIRELFMKCQDRTAEYFEIETGGNVWISIERLTAKITIEDVQQVPGIQFHLDDGETIEGYIDYYKAEQMGQQKLKYEI